MRNRRLEPVLSNHHRKPRSRGGSSDPSNLVRVTRIQHRAWHALFHNYKPETIAEIINDTWLDPDYEVVVRRKS